MDGKKTSIIFGMPYIIESLLRKHKPGKVVLAFDGGSHTSRLTLLPTYKKRDHKLNFDSEDFFKQKDIARDLLRDLGIPIIWKKGFEADDLIAMLSLRESRKEKFVTIVSGDKDFNQLIDGFTTVWNSQNGERYNKINLKHKVGYHPEQCVDYLCLTGDHSDNIPGYGGIGEKRAIEFLDMYPSIREYLKSGQKYKSIDNNKLAAVYKTNRQLIDLGYFYRHFMVKENIPWLYKEPEINLNSVRFIAKSYEVGTFNKPDFLKTFTSL